MRTIREVNVQTGAVVDRVMTPEELAVIPAYVEAVKETPPTLVDQILSNPDDVKKLKEALGLA